MNDEQDILPPKINRIWKSRIFLDTLFWISIFLTMIAGMLAKACFDNLQNNERLDLSWDFFLRREILLPVFVSPMVFGGIYGIIRQAPHKNIGTFIFAFQNGFFWKAILGQAEKQPSFEQ